MGKSRYGRWEPCESRDSRTVLRGTLGEIPRVYSLNKRLEKTVRERTAELRASEARYRSLTELASDWYWEQDESGNFTKVSGPVLGILGIPVDDLAGRQGEAMGGWDEEARGKLQARIAARQPFLDFVLSRVNSDGSQQWYRISGQPMFNRSCRYIGYRGIGVELTASTKSRTGPSRHVPLR
jgi:PAS domain S-box-containing protein